MMENTLYYGDNLKVIKEHIQDNTIDLIYLDPPFSSKADYNILFREATGAMSEAQITAFEDTWHWTIESEKTFNEIIRIAPANVIEMMKSIRQFLGQNDVMAYLTSMCIRLMELERVLKPTGSIYLHCDPTASHYLKILMDTIFGKTNFKNEIIWRRSQTRSSISKIFKRAHDTIFLYVKSDNYKFEIQYKELSEASKSLYTKKDKNGYYRLVPLVVSGIRKGETGKTWRGIDPNLHGKSGSHWVTIPRKLEEYEKRGLIVWPQKKGGLPQLKYYLKDNKGVPITDFWDDIDLIQPSSIESLGYPTQKPEILLERIIKAGSNEGDIVLDPFCGCGTTVCVAQKLNRKWIGIDITHLAVNLMKFRLQNMFGLIPKKHYKVIGEPEDIAGAIELASQNRYQFQWWALSLINAKPFGDKKKGADKGIDGYMYFREKARSRKMDIKSIIVQVKSGKVGVKDIRDLGHVIDREKSPIGIFITLEKPTKPMIKEAVTKGFYRSELYQRDFQRIQIITIEELLNDKMPKVPNINTPYKKAKRYEARKPQLDVLKDYKEDYYLQ